jgi:hypothetical protein
MRNKKCKKEIECRSGGISRGIGTRDRWPTPPHKKGPKGPDIGV